MLEVFLILKKIKYEALREEEEEEYLFFFSFNRHKPGVDPRNMCAVTMSWQMKFKKCVSCHVCLCLGHRGSQSLIQYVPAQAPLREKYGPNDKTAQQVGFHSKPTPQLHLSACSTKYKHGQLRRAGPKAPWG